MVRSGSRVVESASSLRVFPLLDKFCGPSGLPMETSVLFGWLTDMVLKAGDLFCEQYATLMYHQGLLVSERLSGKS